MRKPKTKHLITPRVNERGRYEAQSAVTPHKLSGGKRKGRSMKVKPHENNRASVTMENLKNGRDNGGFYDTELKCVTYHRPEIIITRTLKGYGKA